MDHNDPPQADSQLAFLVSECVTLSSRIVVQAKLDSEPDETPNEAPQGTALSLQKYRRSVTSSLDGRSKTHLCVKIPVQKYERPETRYSDAEMRFDNECSLEKVVILGPVNRQQLFSQDGAAAGFLWSVVHHASLVVQFAQCAECQDQVHAAHEAWVMLDIPTIV